MASFALPASTTLCPSAISVSVIDQRISGSSSTISTRSAADFSGARVEFPMTAAETGEKRAKVARLGHGGPFMRCASTKLGPDRDGVLESGGDALKLELFDPIADLIAVQAQQLRCAGLVPAAPVERLHDEGAFQLLEIDAVGGQLNAFGQADPAVSCHGEIFDSE